MSKPVQHVLRVRRHSDHEVVRIIDVTGKSQREITKVEAGLLRNMDRDRFYVDECKTHTYDASKVKLFIDGKEVDVGPERKQRRRKG